MMFIPVLLFIVGLVLLIKGGDWFVDGATGIAHRFGLPEILIGATVVSIGTTLPEVMVSATSAFGGHGEIAYGNAIGSIICNTALVAALTVTIRPGKVDRRALLLPVAFFFGSAAVYCGFAYGLGGFSRLSGGLLLAIFAAYMVISVVRVLRTPIEEVVLVEGTGDAASGDSLDKKAIRRALLKDIALLIVGAAVIAVGADLLVDNGTIIAQGLGVPESVIALTFMALGTSLPELVTAVTSLIKGHGALSLGNVIGANLFNLVLVSGVSTLLSPFELPAGKQIMGMNASLVVDVPVMLTVMLLLTIPTLIRKRLSRVQGIALLVIYAAFCVFQFAV